MPSTPAIEKIDRRVLRLKGGLLAVWLLVSFGSGFFARDLQWMVAGWQLNYWIAAQGAILAFIGIVAYYAWVVNGMEDGEKDESHRAIGKPSDD